MYMYSAACYLGHGLRYRRGVKGVLSPLPLFNVREQSTPAFSLGVLLISILIIKYFIPMVPYPEPPPAWMNWGILSLNN